jgi:hypothetical protein
MDGTFDQLAPIYRLLEMRPRSLYSFDLSSATDRFSVEIQRKLMEFLIGPRLSEI